VPAEHIAKGRALEQAVKFIQETILESSPELRGTSFSIENNVRDRSSGVLHEIDVLVKTHLRTDYEATWIFECKNWSEPVGKNEVIVLAEKVEALRASKGFLVAKSITSEAKAQLELKKRLSFIRCSEDFLSPLISAEIIHTVADPFPVSLQIKYRGESLPPPNLPSPDVAQLDCLLDGKPTNFLSYIQSHIDDMIRKDMKNNKRRYDHCGTHWGQTWVQMCFWERELVVGGIEVEFIIIPHFFFVKTARSKILSKFELEGRGRVYSFEPIEDYEDGQKLEIQMMQRL